jgi:type VI secretion system secreted protein VgrG
MPDVHLSRCEFQIKEQPDLKLAVVDVSGKDAISKPYEFGVTLASESVDIAPGDMTKSMAVLRFVHDETTNAYSGVIRSFKYLHSQHGVTFYRAILAARMKLLSLTQHNQIFLGKTLPEILQLVFKESRLSDYELRLQQQYPAMDYVCQYNESNLNFVSRLMEHWGVYYFFEETRRGELLVVTDTHASHAQHSDVPLEYLQPSGLDHTQTGRSVKKFICKHKIVPGKVILKDYNYDRPELDLLAEAPADPDGVGEYYSYGDHFRTKEEGEALARIRAQELLAEQEVYAGASTARSLRAGLFFSLSRHPHAAYNAEYLVVSVEHKARDKDFRTAGLDGRSSGMDRNIDYGNTLESIPSSRQFRPERTTPKTKVHGGMHATVDSEGSGQYAMIDDRGRYKIRLPFDLAGRPEGKASYWLRLAEPYAGGNYGMHFPLLKGAEVLLGFVHADPDRPFIAHAVHNGQNPNMVKDANCALNTIKTAGNNQIILGDKKGEEFIGLYSPFHKSSIAIGSTVAGGGGSIDKKTKGESNSFTLGNENSCVVGTSNEATVGSSCEFTLAMKSEVTVGMTAEYSCGDKLGYNWAGVSLEAGNESFSYHEEVSHSGLEKCSLRGGYNTLALAEYKKLTKWFHVLGVAPLLGSVGVTLTTETFSDDGCFSDMNSGIKNGLAVAGVTAIAASAVTAGVGLAMLHKQLKKIEKKAKETFASSLDLSQEGAHLSVAGWKAGLSKAIDNPIRLEAISTNTALAQEFDRSFLSIEKAAYDADVVKLVNKFPKGGTDMTKSAYLSMSNAQDVMMSVREKAWLALHADASSPGRATLASAGKGGVTVGADKLEVATAQGERRVTIHDDGLDIVSDKNCKIAVNKDLVVLFGANKEVSISGAKKISMGKALTITDSKVEIGGTLSLTAQGGPQSVGRTIKDITANLGTLSQRMGQAEASLQNKQDKPQQP